MLVIYDYDHTPTVWQRQVPGYANRHREVGTAFGRLGLESLVLLTRTAVLMDELLDFVAPVAHAAAGVHAEPSQGGRFAAEVMARICVR
jgi:hypothetical protein